MKNIIMEKELLKSFGEHVKNIRLTRKISQEELALKAELDRTYISGIERGLRNVSLINIFKISKALDSTASELMLCLEDFKIKE
jgi:transcriptional regulator with XRE-family HTH domain